MKRLLGSGLFAMWLLAAPGCNRVSSKVVATPDAGPRVSSLSSLVLEELDAELQFSPTQATWLGDHSSDERLDDVRIDAIWREVTRLGSMHERVQRFAEGLSPPLPARLDLQSIPDGPEKDTQRLDTLLLLARVEALRFEREELRPHERSPLFYAELVAWGLDELVTSNLATGNGLRALRGRLQAVPLVLKEAQAKGYAEADPTFDIEGVDAGHKISILAALAFGIPLSFDKAHVEGITKIEAIDIRYAEEMGYRIKLLGIARRRGDGSDAGFELRVHPTLIPAKRLIANVEGVMNAVLVKGDAVGATLYYGAGAGAQPTASAVIADLVDVARLIDADVNHRVPYLAFQPDRIGSEPVLPIDEVETSYYLRLRVDDKPGVLADITRVLADNNISIDAMLQKEPAEGEAQTDIILLTHETIEKNVKRAIAAIEAQPSTRGKIVLLRLENLA